MKTETQNMCSPQEPALFSGSVYDNISMGRPPPHLFGRDAPTDAEVLEAARLAGIPTPPRDAMASESEAVSNANTASDGMSVQSTRKTSLSVWTPVGEGGL